MQNGFHRRSYLGTTRPFWVLRVPGSCHLIEAVNLNHREWEALATRS